MGGVRVGIDVDGVLFPWEDIAREVVSRRFGIPTPAPSSHWHYLKETLPPSAWRWLWTEEGQNAVFSQVGRTYPGVVEAVSELLKAHEVHFVTHRDPRRATLHTATFLTLHFGRHPWAGVHIIRNSVHKHTLAHWDAFVDDKPETVWKFLEQERAQVFSPVRPWNEELEDSLNLRRYTDPWEIVEALT